MSFQITLQIQDLLCGNDFCPLLLWYTLWESDDCCFAALYATVEAFSGFTVPYLILLNLSKYEVI